MDNVHCQGEEEFLSHRRSNDWGNHDYNHGEDASVDCIPLPYWAYVTAFSQNGILLDYLFPRKRLLEPTYVIRSMKREEKKKKKGCLMRERLRTKTTQISPFFCCIPVFKSLLSLPCRSQEEREERSFREKSFKSKTVRRRNASEQWACGFVTPDWVAKMVYVSTILHGWHI